MCHIRLDHPLEKTIKVYMKAQLISTVLTAGIYFAYMSQQMDKKEHHVDYCKIEIYDFMYNYKHLLILLNSLLWETDSLSPGQGPHHVL